MPMPPVLPRPATWLLLLLLVAVAALQPVASVVATMLGPLHLHRVPAPLDAGATRAAVQQRDAAQPSHYRHAITGWLARQPQTDAQARAALEARSQHEREHERQHALGQRHHHDSADASVLRQAGGSDGDTAPADGAPSAGAGAALFAALGGSGTVRPAAGRGTAAAGWRRLDLLPFATQYPRRIERPPNPAA